jgi:hypothetical protein
MQDQAHNPLGSLQQQTGLYLALSLIAVDRRTRRSTVCHEGASFVSQRQREDDDVTRFQV